MGEDDGQGEGAQHHAGGEEKGELRLRVGLDIWNGPLGNKHRQSGQCVEEQHEEGIEDLGRGHRAGQDQEGQAHARKECADDEAARVAKGKPITNRSVAGVGPDLRCMSISEQVEQVADSR